MTPTPTPRTDAQTFDPYPWNNNGPGRSHRPEVMYPCDDGDYVRADFARQLERENQTFRAAQKACEDCDAPRVDRIAELERELAEWREMIDREVGTLREELAAERALADRLADHLDTALGAFDNQEAPHVVRANRTLAAWKGARSGTV